MLRFVLFHALTVLAYQWWLVHEWNGKALVGSKQPGKDHFVTFMGGEEYVADINKLGMFFEQVL